MVMREIGGRRWYLACRHFPTANMAKRQRENAESRAPGVVAEGFIAGGEDSGAPEGTHVVVVLTPDRPMIRRVEKWLGSGTVFQPTEEFIAAVVARHAGAFDEVTTGEGLV
jgi:hypothetical protein